MSSRFGILLIAVTGAVRSECADAQNWLESRIAIEKLADAERFAEAVELEQPFLAMIGETFGEESLELANSYLYMAPIHTANGDFLTAEARIVAAIDLYELQLGPNSIELMEPFLTLGDGYFDADEYALALTAYQEARTIGRRTFGLLNLAQLDIIDRMSEAALALGDSDEALELQQEGLHLVQRRFGEDSEEFLEANYRYVGWLVDHYDYTRASQQYLVVERIIKQHFDDDPALLIRFLRFRADNERRMMGAFLRSKVEPVALNRAIRLLDDLRDATGKDDPLLHAEILRDMGDWAVAFGREWEIEEHYLGAWNLLARVDDGESIRRQWFGEMTAVHLGALISRSLTTRYDAPHGMLSLKFGIDTEGRAYDIVVIESDPPGLLDDAVIRQVRNSRFRPRVEDGVLVESEGASAWKFQYLDE